MERERLRKILDIIFDEKHKEYKRQETFSAFVNAYTDSPYVCLDTSIDVILAIMLEIDVELSGDISYFLYEAPHFYPSCKITHGDKEWVIADDESAKEYILNTYGE